MRIPDLSKLIKAKMAALSSVQSSPSDEGGAAPLPILDDDEAGLDKGDW